MRQSYPFDPALHPKASLAGQGRCSWHQDEQAGSGNCDGEAVVSFQDSHGEWQAGCQRALDELVRREEILPLGQGA